MSKLRKTYLIAALLILAGVFFIFSREAMTVRADSAAFEMLGMSIRYSDADQDEGIRFGVKLDLATYNALTVDDNAKAGILVTPNDMIKGELSLATKDICCASNGVLYSGETSENNLVLSGNDDYAVGIVYLHGFPQASYNRPITAVAYIDWAGDGTDVSYSDSVSVAMADVALAVINDYNGANFYGTTEEQATKLDDYLLNYDVQFQDAFGVTNTQSVKYGDEYDIPQDPASRTGFVFDGWYRKTANNTYQATATDFTNRTVKSPMTFKAKFNADGPTYVKPALDTSSAVFTEGSWSRINQTQNNIRINGSAYLFNEFTIPYGDYDNDKEDAEYTVSATFRPTASGANKVYPRVGFTFSGAEGKHLEVAYDAYNGGKIKVYQKGDDSKYRFYSIESGTEPYKEGVALGSNYQSTTLTVKFKNPKYFDVYIDGKFACEINLRFNYFAGGAGGNKEKHCATIGTSDANELRVGLSVDNGYAEFSDWSCRLLSGWTALNSESDSYCTIRSFEQNAYSEMTTVDVNKGTYLIDGVSFSNWTSDISNKGTWLAGGVEKNPTFQISAKVYKGSTATKIGFAFTTNKTDVLKVLYVKSDNKIRIEYGNYYRQYKVKSGLYKENEDNTLAVRYDGSIFMEFYINGESAMTENGCAFTFKTGAFEDTVTKQFIHLRYGFDGEDSSHVGSVSAYQGFGNGTTLYAGVCALGGSATMTVNPKSYKILSIGSSFATDAHRYLHDIALKDNINIYTVNMFYSGCNLEQHYNYLVNETQAYNYEQNGLRTNNKVSIQDMIHKEDWDVITVQNSSARSTRYDKFFPYLTELVNYIRSECPDSKVYLHETWSYADGSAALAGVEDNKYPTSEAMYAAISDVHERAAAEAGVDGIVYSGKAMLEAIKIYNQDIFRGDDMHASRGAGRYLLALVWYKTFTGRDVSENGFKSFDETVEESVRQNIIQIVNNNV